MSKIHLVAAMGMQNEIGVDGHLPWQSPADMAHFRRTTENQIVVMGRKTAESLRKALPNRTNLVVTSWETAPHPGMIVAHSLTEAIGYAQRAGKDLYVIGGEGLYSEALPVADVLHLTHVLAIFPEADTHFPNVNLRQFHATWAESHPASDTEPHALLMVRYERPR